MDIYKTRFKTKLWNKNAGNMFVLLSGSDSIWHHVGNTIHGIFSRLWERRVFLEVRGLEPQKIVSHFVWGRKHLRSIFLESGAYGR